MRLVYTNVLQARHIEEGREAFYLCWFRAPWSNVSGLLFPAEWRISKVYATTKEGAQSILRYHFPLSSSNVSILLRAGGRPIEEVLG